MGMYVVSKETWGNFYGGRDVLLDASKFIPRRVLNSSPIVVKYYFRDKRNDTDFAAANSSDNQFRSFSSAASRLRRLIPLVRPLVRSLAIRCRSFFPHHLERCRMTHGGLDP